jgi:hypothetical protein
MPIIHKLKMRHKMWKDYAATDPINRFSEARGGCGQEGASNMKFTERVQTEEVKMRRYDKQHVANAGKYKYHYN